MKKRNQDITNQQAETEKTRQARLLREHKIRVAGINRKLSHFLNSAH